MCTVRIKNRTAVKRLDNNLKKLNDDNIWELWVNKAMRDEVDYAIEALESIQSNKQVVYKLDIYFIPKYE